MREGRGFEVYQNKNIYFGSFKDNRRHGQGNLYKVSTGEVFKGEWYQGMKHGFCEWKICDSLFKFSGMWKNNRPEGYGKLTTHKGDAYEGNFIYGKKHGTGVEVFTDGGSYIGNYKNGLPEGHGKLIDKDGTTYVGQFKNGKKHGAGQWRMDLTALDRFKDAEFKGEMRDDKLAGQGKVGWDRGINYNGGFLNNLRHGKGECSWQDGTSYNGNWVEGKANGYGVL